MKTVAERYTKRKRLSAYKAAHGGRDPADPAFVAALKTIAPCLFRAQRERDPLHLQGVSLATGQGEREGEEDKAKSYPILLNKYSFLNVCNRI